MRKKKCALPSSLSKAFIVNNADLDGCQYNPKILLFQYFGNNQTDEEFKNIRLLTNYISLRLEASKEFISHS